MTSMRVALVHMPFGLVERPSLGLSLLKPALQRRGVACDVLYPDLGFVALLGLDGYRLVANGLPEHALAGEWVFGEALFGGETGPYQEYGTLLLSRWKQPLELLELLRRARAVNADSWKSSWSPWTGACTTLSDSPRAAIRTLRRSRPRSG